MLPKTLTIKNRLKQVTLRLQTLLIPTKTVIYNNAKTDLKKKGLKNIIENKECLEKLYLAKKLTF